MKAGAVAANLRAKRLVAKAGALALAADRRVRRRLAQTGAATSAVARCAGALALAAGMAVGPLAAQNRADGAADAILRAMKDELARSRSLQIAGLEAPYFIEYGLHDTENASVSASLGGLLGVRRNRYRLPRVYVRVGGYPFDNTNYIGSDAFSASGVDQFPLDDSYLVLRHHLWLVTDAAYKGAVEAIARKRAALQNATAGEQVPDFSKAAPLKLLLPRGRAAFDEKLWTERVRRLSAVFAGYPAVTDSMVDVDAAAGSMYLVNSEGSEIRIPEGMIAFRARASAVAPDGMRIRDAFVLHSLDAGGLPAEAELERKVRELAANVSSLAQAPAPAGESYAGPVLFEGIAAAQIFAEAFGRDMAPTRRPVTPPGRNYPFRTSELEGRIGARVLPEWMDVTDDPTRREWQGRLLFGYYRTDLEGVAPKPLILVEKGVLKNLLLTRRPAAGFTASNGRARLPGPFGARTASFGNLFVQASETLPAARLKEKLIALCRERNKPYGILVRKMDFPSSAAMDEVRQMMAGAGGGERPLSIPALVYKVYPDGREELVRGLRLRRFSPRSLRDIVAASDEMHVFDYLENGALFALMGGATFAAETSVVAPSILIDDVELAPAPDQLTRPPLAPAPPLDNGSF